MRIAPALAKTSTPGWRSALGAACTLALLGCADEPAVESAPPARVVHQRLEALLPAIGDPAAELKVRREPVSSAETVVREWPGGAEGFARWVWRPGVDVVGEAPDERAPEPTAAGIRLGPGVLATTVQVGAGQFHRLRLRVRPTPGEGGEPLRSEDFTVILQPLHRMVDLPGYLATEDFLTLGRRLGTRSRYRPAVQIDPGAGKGWQELAVALSTPFDTACLLVTVLVDEACTRRFECEQVRLVQISARRALGLVGDGTPAAVPDHEPGSGGLHGPLGDLPPDLARRAEVRYELRDALLLPPPSRVSLRTLLPTGDVVLEFGRALLDEDRPGWHEGDIDLRVRLTDEDGVEHTLHEERLGPAEDPGWVDRKLELDRWSDQLVRIEFESDADSVEDVLLIGSPHLRVRSATDRRPNVVIVSLDTLRPDRLGIGGGREGVSPFLDALAREEIRFTEVSSTSGYTLPAHASLLTGQLPRLHGVRRVGAGMSRLGTRRSEPLAVRLAAEGFATAAFTGGVYMGPDFGFDLGFERFDWLDVMLSAEDGRWEVHPRLRQHEYNLQVRASRRVDHVLRWTGSQRDGPFFLLLHTYLVHNYRPSPAYREQFYEDRGSTVGDSLAWPRRRFPEGETVSEVDLLHFRDLYDATIRQADDEVRRLVEGLKEQGLWERTVFLLVSDHGEEFGERGEMGHGHSLYEELLAVPAILHLPGEAGARRVDEAVSLVDFQPTLLDLLGLPPRVPVQGRSLLPLLRGEPWDERPRFADLALAGTMPRLAVRRGDAKLIATFEDDDASDPPVRIELYDLGNDPGERDDLSSRRPAEAAQLLDLVLAERRALQAAADAMGGAGDSGDLSEEMREQLQRLGYLDPGN